MTSSSGWQVAEPTSSAKLVFSSKTLGFFLVACALAVSSEAVATSVAPSVLSPPASSSGLTVHLFAKQLQKRPEHDVFKDTPLRYLGYANELGESFRPLISRFLYRGSYVVA
eukprot:2701630-Rhodomonas_salina.1